MTSRFRMTSRVRRLGSGMGSTYVATIGSPPFLAGVSGNASQPGARQAAPEPAMECFPIAPAIGCARGDLLAGQGQQRALVEKADELRGGQAMPFRIEMDAVPIERPAALIGLLEARVEVQERHAMLAAEPREGRLRHED